MASHCMTFVRPVLAAGGVPFGAVFTACHHIISVIPPVARSPCRHDGYIPATQGTVVRLLSEQCILFSLLMSFQS